MWNKYCSYISGYEKKRNLFNYLFSITSTKVTALQTTRSFHKDNTLTNERGKIEI